MTDIYYTLRPLLGHRIVWATERLWCKLRGIELCAECGDRASYHVWSDEVTAYRAYCRTCGWVANKGSQPYDDDDNEPPGAGTDPYGRPDPQTNPEYWRE